jgi:subtilisin family serine protease
MQSEFSRPLPNPATSPVSGNSTDLERSENRGAAPLFVPNQVMVKFKPGVQSADAIALQSSLRATVQGTTKTLGIQLWQISGLSVDEAIARFRNDPRIEYIEPNYLGSIDSTFPNDPNFSQLWGLNNTGQNGGTLDADIDAPEAWDIATDSSDMVVGVIDTGVDYTHPDLADNIWTNPGETAGDGIDNDGNGYIDDIHGYDFVNNDGDPMDDNSHGTHVSGTIAGRGNNSTGVAGVNWSGQIMGVKWIAGDGFGDTFDAIQAVEYTTIMKNNYGVNINLTNNSWRIPAYSQGLSDAIAASGSAGQLFIAAAGNYEQDTDTDPMYPAAYNLDNIISVAATDRNDNIALFSNYGATTVDLGAPGVDIYSTVPGNTYDSYDGTSMASPHVAGVAALLWSQYPSLTASEIKDTLLATVDPIAALDGITVTGGRLNAYQALLGPTASRISGTSWNDANSDGTLDEGESTLADWTVYLDENNNGTLDTGEKTAITDEDGNYTLNFVAPGTYTIAAIVKPGWTQTSPIGAQTVIVGENETVIGINFGNFLSQPASLSGSKWKDLNQNAIWDDGEPPLSGWTIYLDANQNSTLDEGEVSTATDADGTYSFANLAPGQYTVAEVQQTNWQQFYPFFGSKELFVADFSDDSGNPSLDDVTIDNTGAAALGLWHLSTGRGNQPGHSAEGSLYFGTGEGAEGGGNFNVGHTAGRFTTPTIDLTTVSDAELSFNYFLASEGGNPWDSAKVMVSANGGAFEEIASNGSGLLTDPTTGWTAATLDLGDYAGSSIQVRFDFDSIDSVINNLEGWYVDDVIVRQVGDGSHTVELDPDEVVTDVNFGNYVEPATVSGSQWVDRNGNGVQDADDTELAGWTVYLDVNNNGALDADETSAVTDRSGNYTLTTDPGSYTLAEVLPVGWQATVPPLGQRTIELNPGENLIDLDFGNQFNGAAIDGTVGNDVLNGTPNADVMRGLQGSDRLQGQAGADLVSGGTGADTLYGNQDDDTLYGGLENDNLYGGLGRDRLYGDNNRDFLQGGRDNDFLSGGNGLDTLIGVTPGDINPGLGEIDVLQGGAAADLFALGNAANTFYNDGNDADAGLADYAEIADFILGQDTIRLQGTAVNYVVAASPVGSGSDAAIFRVTAGVNELIAVTKNVAVADLVLASSSFVFV